MRNIFNNINLKQLFLLGFGFITLLNIPYFLFAGNIYIGDSWDFLDSNLVWFKLLIEKKALFQDNAFVFSEYMSSPRISFGSEFNILTWLVYFFGPYFAFVINQVLAQIIALGGMILLLNKYVFKGKFYEFNGIISITFALLPFWQPGGLSVAGMPIMLFVFLEIINKNGRWYYFLIPIIYSLYSFFFVFGLFFIIFLFVIYLSYTVKTKKNTITPILFLALMTVTYIVADWRIFYETLIRPSFIPHRAEFFLVSNLSECVAGVKESFLFGQGHVKSLHTIIILLALVAIYFSFKYKKDKKIILLLLSLSLISIFHGFWVYDKIYFIKNTFSLFKSFQVDRFYVLYPLVWFLIYGLSVFLILDCKDSKLVRKLLYLFAFFQLLYVMKNNVQVRGDIDLLIDNKLLYSYNEYYAKPIFDQIKKDINLAVDDYKVLSVGIDPSIAAFNGIHTIDGYNSYYALEYKHQFRKIISEELALNAKNKKYFDNWGNRCYVFDDQPEFIVNNFEHDLKIKRLQLNYVAVKEMKGKFIISTYRIMNTPEIGFRKQYSDKLRSYYLYQVL